METKEVFKRPTCRRCGSGTVRVRRDGSVVCYRCGYVDKNNEGIKQDD